MKTEISSRVYYVPCQLLDRGDIQGSIYDIGLKKPFPGKCSLMLIFYHNDLKQHTKLEAYLTNVLSKLSGILYRENNLIRVESKLCKVDNKLDVGFTVLIKFLKRRRTNGK